MVLYKKHIFLGILCSLLFSSLIAQQPKYAIPASVLGLPDTAFNGPRDTIEQKFLEKDTLQYKLTEEIEKAIEKSKIMKLLSPILFTNAEVDSSTTANENFYQYNNKVVRSIEIIGLDPYQQNPLHPTENKNAKRTERWADRLNVQTKKFVLRNNLMVREGDRIDHELLVHNLAYFRSLPYIYDASWVVNPVGSDSVDLKLIARDLWTVGFDVRDINLQETNIELYDKNILGLGLELRAGLLYQKIDRKVYWSYSLSQHTANIRGTFISNDIQWIETKQNKFRLLKVSRAILPNTKHVGGLSYAYSDKDHFFITIDSLHRVQTESLDVWGGYVVDFKKVKSHIAPRLALQLRISNRSTLSQMPTNAAAYYPYESSHLVIGSISLFKQSYYTGRLIYGFGVNEVIPFGFKVGLQAGYENHSYDKRFYSSLLFRHGKQFSWGYSYIGTSISGYLSKGKLADGMLSLRYSYFTPLIPIGQQALRQFFYVSYTQGINRRAGEGNYLGYANNLLFDVNPNNISLFGKNRLTLSSETDLFSSARLFSFRFVFFSFFDATWLGNNSNIFSNSFFPGLGAGIRIRNDKLVFRTLQVKLAWYPKFSQAGIGEFFSVSGADRFPADNFTPETPHIIEYK